MTNAVVNTRPGYRVEVPVGRLGVHEAESYGVESPS
jgi:hypothetical protein